MTSPFPLERWRQLHERVTERLKSEPHRDALRLFVALEELLAAWLNGDAAISAAIIGSQVSKVAAEIAPQAHDRERRRQVAIHESAHTVALLEFGLSFDRVTVDMDPRVPDAAGFVEGIILPATPMSTDRQRIRLERRVLVELVANAAEELGGYWPSPDDVAAHLAEADRLLLRLTPALAVEEVRALRDFLRARAKRLARELWPRIEQLADELVRRGSMTRADVLAVLHPSPKLEAIPA